MRLELNKKYELSYIEGKPVFWLHTIESFLYHKSYVVHLTIADKPGISTLRFSTHPSEDDVYTIQKDGQIFTWTNSMFEDEDVAFQCAIAKAVNECLWGTNDEIDVYKETDPTEKLVDDSVEFGKNVMRKKITEYLLKYLPMTPDDKEAFIEEMNKNIK